MTKQFIPNHRAALAAAITASSSFLSSTPAQTATETPFSTLTGPSARDGGLAAVPQWSVPSSIAPISIKNSSRGGPPLHLSPLNHPLDCLRLSAAGVQDPFLVRYTTIKGQPGFIFIIEPVEPLPPSRISFTMQDGARDPSQGNWAEALWDTLSRQVEVRIPWSHSQEPQGKRDGDKHPERGLLIGVNPSSSKQLSQLFDLLVCAQADGITISAVPSAPGEHERAAKEIGEPTRFDILYGTRRGDEQHTLLRNFDPSDVAGFVDALKPVAPLLIGHDPRVGAEVRPSVLWVSSQGETSRLHSRLLSALGARGLCYRLIGSAHESVEFSVVEAQQDRLDINSIISLKRVRAAGQVAAAPQEKGARAIEDISAELPAEWLELVVRAVEQRGK